jgi:small subunit ribosomal protein S4
MGRYTGPVEKLSRREDVDLCLKGERRLAGKSALERRGDAPPGQHARRARKESVYGRQLREKQKLKRWYGIRERQLLRYLKEALRRSDAEHLSGHALLQALELRLDNVVYRLGLANTRPQARQMVNHGHVAIDGRRCDIASAHVRPGQQVALFASSPVRPIAQGATEMVGRVPRWLEADHDGLAGRVLRPPTRDEVDTPVEEQLVVELLRRR